MALILLIFLAIWLIGEIRKKIRGNEAELNGLILKIQADLESSEKENAELFKIMQELVIAIEAGNHSIAFLAADKARKKYPGLLGTEQVWSERKEGVLSKGLP